jgi:protein-tyrosine kinase
MLDKIEKVKSFLKPGKRSIKKETVEISLQNNGDERNKERSGPDKIEKAIYFFKQKQISMPETTSPVTVQTNTPEMPGDTLTAGTGESHTVSTQHADEKMPEVHSQKNPEEVPAQSLQPQTSAISGGFLQNHAQPKTDNNAEAKTDDKVESEAEAEYEDEAQYRNNHQDREKEKPGWVSPAYSQSRRIQLNPKFIAENRCLVYLDNVPEAESYRILRTQILQRTKGTGGNTIMLTSALPGEGKTLTAINLAFTFAREFQHTVLLVDGDLRKQSIHKYLGCGGEKGLIDYLADDVPVSELIIWPGVEKMTIISGGRSYDESAEMLGSLRMKELITDMKVRYPDRYILFDVPPVLAGADALTFAPFVDHVIMVVQAGKTSMDDVQKAIQFIPKEKVLGFVLNRF